MLLYLLCVIDAFKKYALVKPLKDKKAKTVVYGFIKILNESKQNHINYGTIKEKNFIIILCKNG